MHSWFNNTHANICGYLLHVLKSLVWWFHLKFRDQYYRNHKLVATEVNKLFQKPTINTRRYLKNELDLIFVSLTCSDVSVWFNTVRYPQPKYNVVHIIKNEDQYLWIIVVTCECYKILKLWNDAGFTTKQHIFQTHEQHQYLSTDSCTTFGTKFYWRTNIARLAGILITNYIE